MNRTVNVPEFFSATLRRWRDTPSQGEIPILRKVRLRGQYGIAIVCGDDRMCVQTLAHLITHCEAGSLWPIIIAGGALDLTNHNPEIRSYETFISREVGKFLAAKRVPETALIDVLALGHVDCGFARVNSISLYEQLERLYSAKLVLEGLFSYPRFEVRTGFHMVWDGDKHNTYELDVPSALNDLEEHERHARAQSTNLMAPGAELATV